MEDKTKKGTGFIIAADDGGLYEISHEELIHAARKVPEDDPGHRVLNEAANSGLESAVMTDSVGPQDRNALFVCKSFSQCSHAKNFFINVRGGGDAVHSSDDGECDDK